jgi:AraC-like DNA-binding protein
MAILASENVLRAPALPLRGIVARYNGFRYSGSTPGIQHALPSRYVSLVVSLESPIEVVHSDQSTASFDMLVGGLHTRPIAMQDLGGGRGVIAQVEPLAAGLLLGVPASALVGQVVDLGSVWKCAPELWERLAMAGTWPECFAVLDELFVRTMQEGAGALPEVGRAWAHLVATAGTVRIADLAADVGWGRRNLLERFQAEVGLGPKQVARVVRFERASALLEQRSPAGVAAVALNCGYYDQAHMASEWRALTGMTVTRWLAQELRDPLVEGAAA